MYIKKLTKLREKVNSAMVLLNKIDFIKINFCFFRISHSKCPKFYKFKGKKNN